jgi:hypothetical protein
VPLLEEFIKVSGGIRITREQVIEAETNHLLNELVSGEHTVSGTLRGVTVIQGKNLRTARQNAHRGDLNS